MIRLWLLAVGLICVTQLSTQAAPFRCRTPDGTLVFTDEATRVPADCRPVEETPNRGTLTILPGRESAQTESPDLREPSISRPADLPGTTGVPASQAPDQLFRLWKAKVDQLVADYRETLRQRYHATLLRDKRVAMERLEQLKERKKTTLIELSDTPFSSSQKASLRQSLGEIPGP